ncbi:hypothetical protein TWF481_008272 [Arthrobotrys musiformis]|uniref:F-box domain-containing protein n=1 Tax=Arthrobotrys musiformis TaxID=47236 RepID=A0AAV9W6S9_9PEZI
MPSLKEIGAVPELLYEILGYLDPQDTSSLRQTCKALYPVCNRGLWSDLRLYKFDPAEPGPTEGLDLHESIYNRIMKSIRLAQQSGKGGEEGSGLKHTRSLRLHRLSLTWSPEAHSGFLGSGLCSYLGELLSAGGLDLDCVELSYIRRYTAFGITSTHDDDRTIPGRPGTRRAAHKGLVFLAQVQDYLLKKGPGNCSFIVTMSLDPGITDNFRFQTITDLRLELDWTITGEAQPSWTNNYTGGFGFGRCYDDDDDDEYEDDNSTRLCLYNPSSMEGHWPQNDGPDPSQSNVILALQLTVVLKRAVNLKHLSILSVRDFDKNLYYQKFRLDRLEHLVYLRDTIQRMPKLRTLKILGKFFHPSFFCPPPESAKTVVYEGIFSRDWFQQLLNHPLTHVENLRIRYRHNHPQNNAKFLPKFFPFPLIVKEEHVKFRNLRSCKLIGLRNLVQGLAQAILRLNKGLNHASKMNLSGLAAECLGEPVFVKLMGSTSPDSLPWAHKKYHDIFEGRSAADNEQTAELDALAELTVKTSLRSMPTSLEHKADLIPMGPRASQFAEQCEKDIRSLLPLLTPQFCLEYGWKIAEGANSGELPPIDKNTALKEYLRILTEALEDSERWMEKRVGANKFFDRCYEEVEGKVDACVKKYTGERILDFIYRTETESELVAMVAKECAEHLSREAM